MMCRIAQLAWKSSSEDKLLCAPPWHPWKAEHSWVLPQGRLFLAKQYHFCCQYNSFKKPHSSNACHSYGMEDTGSSLQGIMGWNKTSNKHIHGTCTNRSNGDFLGCSLNVALTTQPPLGTGVWKQGCWQPGDDGCERHSAQQQLSTFWAFPCQETDLPHLRIIE